MINIEQLSLEAPEGLLDVVLVTEKVRYEKEYPCVLRVSKSREVIAAQGSRGLLELNNDTRR